jgi:hypothetical protein
VSGIELSSDQCSSLAALELGTSWIVGDAGEMDDQVWDQCFDFTTFSTFATMFLSLIVLGK